MTGENLLPDGHPRCAIDEGETAPAMRSNSNPAAPQHQATASVARWISLLASAPLLAVPAFLLILFSSEAPSLGLLRDIGVSLFFGTCVPIASVLIFPAKQTGSFDVREERANPLLLGAAGYLFGSLILFQLAAPAFSVLLMFCYGTNTLVVFLVNLRWKISIHAMGVAGPTTALLYTVGSAGAVLGLILLPVAWSRIILRKHTAGQVIAGASAGYVLTISQFYVISILLYAESTRVLLVSLYAVILMIPVMALVAYIVPQGNKPKARVTRA